MSMAERHVILIRVRNGTVAGIEFCDCCTDVLVEVRTYTDDPVAAAQAELVWYLGGRVAPATEFKKDEHGVFKANYYEPADGDE
jgi:hypothetical protein